MQINGALQHIQSCETAHVFNMFVFKQMMPDRCYTMNFDDHANTYL